MAFTDVEAKTTIDPVFSPADRTAILTAMETAYNGSPTARSMFDTFIATPGNNIDIQFSSGDFAAGLGTGELFIDLSFLVDNTYITPTGRAVEDTVLTAIVHELGHAIAGLEDTPSPFPASSVDYAGDNVIFVNKIFDELGLPEQLSYVAYDDDGTLHTLNFEYTNGVGIDRALSTDGDWNSSPAGNSSDLLIGGPSSNILQSGQGDDFLFGGAGNDDLNGGAGSGDTVVFTGDPVDYDIRQNPDGTWTSRHVRGTADEGTDTLTNIEKVQFEGGETFELKKEGLTFQTDFAFVIDTTGSMGDDIDAVKARANAVINALFAGDTVDARVGIVGFKDVTIGQPTSIILPFTDQDNLADRKAAALAAIDGITVSGGGDEPETAFDGLLKALNGTMGDWRPGAGIHRVALFTDASAKDGSLASAVAALAANIGATITSGARAEGARGVLNTFELSLPSQEDIAANENTSERTSEDFEPFVPSDDPPTPDTSKATLEIYTIFTGPDFIDTSDFESISETTGGDFLTAASSEDLVDLLLEIIDLPPDGSLPPDSSDLTYEVVTQPGEGSASISGTTLTFDPGDDFQDLAEGETRDVVVQVRAIDESGEVSNTADVTVTVTGKNDDPTLAASIAAATEDGPSIDVDLAALGDDIDSDDDGTSLIYSIVTEPSEGSASIAGTTLTFDPGSDFQGLAVGETREVIVQIQATDSHGATSDVADLVITVTGTNDAPTLAASTLAAEEDGPIVALDLASLADDIDSDDDGSSLTYSIITEPSEGSASISGTTLNFDPGEDFQDLAEGETRDVIVTVLATDSHGAVSDTADIVVTVTGTNDAPFLSSITIGAEEDGPAVDLDLSTITSDVDAGESETTPARALEVEVAGDLIEAGAYDSRDSLPELSYAEFGLTDDGQFIFSSETGSDEAGEDKLGNLGVDRDAMILEDGMQQLGAIQHEFDNELFSSEDNQDSHDKAASAERLTVISEDEFEFA